MFFFLHFGDSLHFNFITFYLHRPQIVFGHVDPGINKGQTTVTTASPAGNYMAVIAITPQKTTTGIHQVCTQTKDPTLRYSRSSMA